MLQIFNSLTGRKQPFEPLHAPRVGMYVCGVTVYDYCHVGHARCYIAFDVIRRWLRYRGYDVHYVRNITDIDDKIIRRAAERGERVEALTERFIRAMHEDFAALAIEPPDEEPRATEYLPVIVSMIERLVAGGHAYAAPGGDVYYAVGSFPAYGQLSGKRLEELRAGARVEVNEAKRDPLDFVLWKSAKPGEPHWPSPWGEGRPGWHIECSAMATTLLGGHFDLHGGGMDLKFPHHENEIAQSEAANGERFVEIWMHNGFVNSDQQKMSKSLGNFFTVREVLPCVRHPEVLRTLLLASHYRGPIYFSAAQLSQADATLERLYTALRGLEEAQGPPAAPAGPAEPRGVKGPGASGVESLRAHFEAALDEDFNTPEAMAALQGGARELNTALAAGRAEEARLIGAELRRLGGLLGLLSLPAERWFKLAPRHALPALSEAAATPARRGGAEAGEGASLDEARIEALIAARLAARAARDWAAADRIREQLRGAGILLEDRPDGRTLWRRGS